MIQGYFSTTGTRRRPFLDAAFTFPGFQHTFEVPLLVDTGADRTIICPRDARRLARELRISLTDLPQGDPSTGVGGQMQTRTIEAIITLDTYSIPLTLTILEAPPSPSLAIPSLLGRDIIAGFALYVEQRTETVLLLEPQEADRVSALIPTL